MNGSIKKKIKFRLKFKYNLDQNLFAFSCKGSIKNEKKIAKFKKMRSFSVIYSVIPSVIIF